MDFKYKDTEYLLVTISFSPIWLAEAQNYKGPSWSERRKSFTLRPQSNAEHQLSCNTLCCGLREMQRGPGRRIAMVCAPKRQTELWRPCRWTLWDFLSSEGWRGVREQGQRSARGFVEEAVLALGLKPQEASEEGIICCSLFTCLVNWETSSLAQRHSSSMGCKPSSAADYDRSGHSKLSEAPRAHLLPVKRKSFQFFLAFLRSKWQICFKCLTEYLPHELLSLERENVPSTPQNEALSDRR